MTDRLSDERLADIDHKESHRGLMDFRLHEAGSMARELLEWRKGGLMSREKPQPHFPDVIMDAEGMQSIVESDASHPPLSSPARPPAGPA